MTLKDLRMHIAASNKKEWFLDFQIFLDYQHSNFRISLKGVPSIYDFIVTQIEGYEKYPQLPEELERIKQRFKAVKENILRLIYNYDTNKNNWDNFLNPITNNTPHIFLINLPETKFLINVFSETPIFFKGAYEYFKGQIQNINNRSFFIGYLMAYEFESKDSSSIAIRKEIEVKSLNEIRIDFHNMLGEANNQMTEYLSQANSTFYDNTDRINNIISEKENEFSGWFKGATNNFLKFNNESIQKIKDYEELYKEKLKLEAPAKYWSDRAKKLHSEGNNWLRGLLAAILIGVTLLIWCLHEISEGTLDKIFQNNGSAIKWSVVFITIISFLAYAIKIFSKLTFSSFHLVRDAEEREQLTYVYLALKQENSIDDTERHLIMQSLFSRADSGLLKDDAGPTMPGNIAEKMIK